MWLFALAAPASVAYFSRVSAAGREAAAKGGGGAWRRRPAASTRSRLLPHVEPPAGRWQYAPWLWSWQGSYGTAGACCPWAR